MREKKKKSLLDDLYGHRGTCARRSERKNVKERERVKEKGMTLPMVCHNLTSSGRQTDRQTEVSPAVEMRLMGIRSVTRGADKDVGYILTNLLSTSC